MDRGKVIITEFQTLSDLCMLAARNGWEAQTHSSYEYPSRIKSLSADQGDNHEELIISGLKFQACVKSGDVRGAWSSFWHILCLSLEIAEEDGGKLGNLVQQSMCQSVDEFYELLFSNEHFWECIQCLRAGVEINGILVCVDKPSLFFNGLEEAGVATSDCMDLEEGHEIMYRVLQFAQRRYKSTSMRNLLAEQSLQLLLLHDNIIFSEMTMDKAASCLQEAWQLFEGEYDKAVEMLCQWIGEDSDMGSDQDESQDLEIEDEAQDLEMGDDHDSESSWPYEMEIKSAGFLGLYYHTNHQLQKAENTLYNCMELLLKHHKVLNESLLQNSIELFGAALFDTLFHLEKSDPYIDWFEDQLPQIETCPSKLLLQFFFGKWLFGVGHKRGTHLVMDRALELLWESGRAFVQEADDINNGMEAYESAMHVAMILMEFDYKKPWEIVEEALQSPEIRYQEGGLWQCLYDLSEISCKPLQSCNPVGRLHRAMEGLEKAQEFALQVSDEKHRFFLCAQIELSMGKLLMYMASSESPHAQVEINKAIKLLQNICERLEEQFQAQGDLFPSNAHDLLQRARDARDDAYSLTDQHGLEAESLFCSSQMSLTDLQKGVWLKSAEAKARSSVHEHETALNLINQAIADFDSIPELPGDWKLQVLLQLKRGSIFQRAGQVHRSLEDMEQAKQLCESHDFDFGSNVDIFDGFMSLLDTYLQCNDVKSAWQLVKGIDATARMSFASEQTSKYLVKYANWESQKSKLLHLIINTEEVANSMSESKPGVALTPDNQGDHLTEKHMFWNKISTEITSEWDAESGLVFFPFILDTMSSIELPLATRHAVIDAGEMIIGRDGQLSDKVSPPTPLIIWKHLFQCCEHLLRREEQLAIKEMQQATYNMELVECQSQETSTSLDLVRMYALQAIVCVGIGNRAEAHTSIEKARVLLEKTQITDDLMYLRAKHFVTLHMDNSVTAAAEAGRKLISRFTQAQQQLPPTMEFAWVQKLDENAVLYKSMELNAAEQDNVSEALLWAERGQMRLFMQVVDSFHKPLAAAGLEFAGNPTEVEGKGKFDENDAFALKILLQALKACPANVAIIKYSYHERDDVLIVYLITECGEKRIMQTTSGMGRKLRLLSKDDHECADMDFFRFFCYRTVEQIKMKADPIAKRDLSILYQLLIKPILTHLPDACDTLLFSIQGFLSSIPLHALYEGSKQEFLIQQMRVCYVPSIRVLHNCFERQLKFKQSLAERTLKPPFVAGDPSPMGKGLHQLPGGREEAKAVARILLGAESCACIGENVTKQAVKKALCESSLIHLSTHCYYDDSAHRHGALVLRRSDNRQQQQGLASSALRGTGDENLPLPDTMGAPHIKASVANESHKECRAPSPPPANAMGGWESLDEDKDLLAVTVRAAIGKVEVGVDDELLTPAEISALQVRAGLVVLDGCGTGQGEETAQEGLLGLGRAVLLGGAAMAVLTLWPVNDFTTKTLVTGVIENAHEEGMDVVGSIQKAMVDMIKKGKKNIYHWAPLIALGSPTMELPSQTLWQLHK